MTKLYGIKNCDTVKKARTWLKDHEIPYEFHNYKKDGADKDVLKEAIKTHGWETVINRRGTTWRHLDEATKESLNEKTAVVIAMENPSIIKRPLLIHDGKSHVGFKPEDYEAIFK